MTKNVKRTARRTSASRKPSSAPPTAKARAPLAQALAAFARIAAHQRLRWYVFGAQAVALHGYPRATADLDITIDLEDRDPRAFVRALSRAGFKPRFADPAFIAATRVIPVTHRASQLPIDLVLAGPGLEQQFLARSRPHRIARHDIPVLIVEDLIVTKLLAGRPKDLQDIRELLVASRNIDHASIDTLLAAIEEALDQRDLRPRYAQLRAESRRYRRD